MPAAIQTSVNSINSPMGARQQACEKLKGYCSRMARWVREHTPARVLDTPKNRAILNNAYDVDLRANTRRLNLIKAGSGLNGTNMALSGNPEPMLEGRRFKMGRETALFVMRDKNDTSNMATRTWFGLHVDMLSRAILKLCLSEQRSPTG